MLNSLKKINHSK